MVARPQQWRPACPECLSAPWAVKASGVPCPQYGFRPNFVARPPAAELAIAAGSAVADEPGVTANTGKPAVNVTQTAGTTGPAIAEHAAQAAVAAFPPSPLAP